MSRDSYSQMESEGFDVSAAASYSGFGFSVGAEFSMSSKQQSASSRFNEEVETYTTSVKSHYIEMKLHPGIRKRNPKPL